MFMLSVSMYSQFSYRIFFLLSYCSAFFVTNKLHTARSMHATRSDMLVSRLILILVLIQFYKNSFSFSFYLVLT